MPFYIAKGRLLHCKRASFTTQKGVDGKAGRKEIDKERAELRRKATPKIRPPQAPPKEGMCLAGYGMLGVGEMEGGRFKAKSSWVNSQGLKFLSSKYALSHTIPLSVNS